MCARPLLPVLATLALAAAVTPAAAAGAGDAAHAPRPGHASPRDGRPLSLEEAVELVQRRFEARVVRAEAVQEGEELVYRIRLLAADGRVFTVRVSARTGGVE
jgi:uncharacterized membrane protein YkoI